MRCSGDRLIREKRRGALLSIESELDYNTAWPNAGRNSWQTSKHNAYVNTVTPPQKSVVTVLADY